MTTAAAESAAQEMLTKDVVNGELVVPERSCFVLGDNRSLSLDSRYRGLVGFGDLIGRPVLIYDSETQSADEPPGRRPLGWRRTRWERLFRVL